MFYGRGEELVQIGVTTGRKRLAEELGQKKDGRGCQRKIFDFHGQIQVQPALRKIPHVDEVVMAFGFRSLPAVDGAGKVERK